MTHTSAQRCPRRQSTLSIPSAWLRLIRHSSKNNEIQISKSEVQVMAAPIPPSLSMPAVENLTKVQSLCMNTLNVLSQQISESVDEYHTIFRLLLQSDTSYTVLQDNIAIIRSSVPRWPTTSTTVGNVSCDTALSL